MYMRWFNTLTQNVNEQYTLKMFIKSAIRLKV